MNLHSVPSCNDLRADTFFLFTTRVPTRQLSYILKYINIYIHFKVKLQNKT